jgi:hypothetical protein
MDSVKSLNTLIDKEEEDQVESLVKKQKLNDDDLSKIGENKLVKKRKYALLIGYQGSGYYGLQRNVTNRVYRTIEDEVVDAMVKINAIPQEHADEMFKMSFQRAARTDKGKLNLKLKARELN